MTERPNPPAEEKEFKSKTQRKKEMIALQELGEQLVSLKLEQLEKIPMPEELLQGVLEAQRMKSHGARRRQLQYLGTLMRQTDPEPIVRALELMKQAHGGDSRWFHMVEEWRDRLVQGDREIMEELCDRFSGMDPAELHRLSVNARREMEAGKPKGARRALFRFIMEHLKESLSTGAQ